MKNAELFITTFQFTHLCYALEKYRLSSLQSQQNNSLSILLHMQPLHLAILRESYYKSQTEYIKHNAIDL